MKSIIARNPCLTARMVTSVILQVVLIVLLRRPHQDWLCFNLGILVISLLATLPVAFVPRWLPFWPMPMIRLLALFPLLVFLATLLDLMGWHVWFGA